MEEPEPFYNEIVLSHYFDSINNKFQKIIKYESRKQTLSSIYGFTFLGIIPVVILSILIDIYIIRLSDYHIVLSWFIFKKCLSMPLGRITNLGGGKLNWFTKRFFEYFVGIRINFAFVKK